MSNTTEALPLQIPTTDFAGEHKGKYERAIDGSFRLKWISSDDTVSMLAHHKEIADGRLAVLPVGETPATIAQKAKENEARTAEVFAILKRNEDQRKKEEFERRKAALERETAELRKQYGF